MNNQFIPSEVQVTETEEVSRSVARDLSVEDPSVEQARALLGSKERPSEQNTANKNGGENAN